MSVIIGIDPHKALHAASAIDRSETQLCELNVRTGPRQLAQLLEWAAPFPARLWAIESAGGLGYLLAQQLVGRGEHVVDVPSTLASRVRLLGSGRSNKNDANDARAVAVAALRARSLQAVRGEDHVSVLRLLAKAHLDISRARSRACSRLHALVRELVPQMATEELYRTLNMGIGMVVMCAPADLGAVQDLIAEPTWVIGRLEPGSKTVKLI